MKQLKVIAVLFCGLSLACTDNKEPMPMAPTVAGKTAVTTVSLVPDPSSIEFLDNGVWHRFTVQASEPVRIVVNPNRSYDLWPLEAAAQLEITTAFERPNWCPAESNDYATRTNGEDIYLAGCGFGKGTVELRRAIDDSLLRTYTLTVDTPPVKVISLLGGATMEMVWIEPGTFTMGSPATEEGRMEAEGPQYEVTISTGFYLGKYEITQGQWEAVMGTTPWTGHDWVVSTPNHPAVLISWRDVQAFIRRLNESARSELYRLPTEAEWEYACRAGTETRWSFGEIKSDLRDYAWYFDNTWNERYGHAVGQKRPNPWGLYDMHGNVSEWVWDWYSSHYYNSSPSVDPQGPSTGSDRVIRGGNFGIFLQHVRSAYRAGYSPSNRSVAVGARLLMTH